MKLAYILFNDLTLLDFAGLYDPISRLRSQQWLPDLEWDLCAYTSNISDGFGMEVNPQKIKNPLDNYDALIVPGGFGTRKLRHDKAFIDWVKTAENVPLKASVCTGSLILGAAGFLHNRKTTTHYNEYETLRTYCAEVIPDRIVEDEDVVTAGAVASSIDLGLYLCEKWAGPEAKEAIRKSMNYVG